jgi:hypothetical protein
MTANSCLKMSNCDWRLKAYLKTKAKFALKFITDKLLRNKNVFYCTKNVFGSLTKGVIPIMLTFLLGVKPGNLDRLCDRDLGSVLPWSSLLYDLI